MKIVDMPDTDPPPIEAIVPSVGWHPDMGDVGYSDMSTEREIRDAEDVKADDHAFSTPSWYGAGSTEISSEWR